MTTSALPETSSARPAAGSSALEQLLAESRAHESRRAELLADLTSTTRALEASRRALGEAVAASADAAPINDSLRELETKARGLEAAIASVDTRRAALSPSIEAERIRIAGEEADRTAAVYAEALEVLHRSAIAAAKHLEELHQQTRRAGFLANQAAITRDRLQGTQATSVSAVQVYDPRALPKPGLTPLLDYLARFDRETKAAAGFAESREQQRLESLASRQLREALRAETETLSPNAAPDHDGTLVSP